MMKSKRIRPGLYKVTTERDTYLIENRLAPFDYGGGWLWYITSDSGLIFDPEFTKANALQAIQFLEEQTK